MTRAISAINRFLSSGTEIFSMDSVPGKRLLIFYHSEGARVMFMANQIVVGSPTYFSNVSWQIKKIIDETYPLRRGRFRLKGKIGGSFTSSDTKRDAEECIRLIELSLGLHHQMETVPGIIVTRRDTEAEVYERCRAYGDLLADKILGAE
jgi:multimeric flavodoxin WrbA